MSAIIPPSIVNYDWTVKVNSPSFLNVSFPFRVKIVSMWFTTQAIYGDTAGFWQGDEETLDIETTDRVLALAAYKTKNSKTQYSIFDNPNDVLSPFEDLGYSQSINEELKPTMWLGNPDEGNGQFGAFSTEGGGFGGSVMSLRSTAASPIEKSRATNSNWSENEWNERTYLADAAVMNTDEFLQVFVYNAGGDWSYYENDAKVTISIAYTGMSGEDAQSASVKTWTDWWND
jgi:hypothetical protein